MTNLPSSSSSTNSFVQEAKKLLSKILKTSKNKGYDWKNNPETVAKIIEYWSKSELPLWEFAKELEVAESVLRRFTHGCTSTGINHKWPELITCFEKLGLSFPHSKSQITKSSTASKTPPVESAKLDESSKLDKKEEPVIDKNIVIRTEPETIGALFSAATQVAPQNNNKRPSKIKIKKNKKNKKNPKQHSESVETSLNITSSGEILVTTTTTIVTVTTKILKRTNPKFKAILEAAAVQYNK